MAPKAGTYFKFVNLTTYLQEKFPVTCLVTYLMTNIGRGMCFCILVHCSTEVTDLKARCQHFASSKKPCHKAVHLLALLSLYTDSY